MSETVKRVTRQGWIATTVGMSLNIGRASILLKIFNQKHITHRAPPHKRGCAGERKKWTTKYLAPTASTRHSTATTFQPVMVAIASTGSIISSTMTNGCKIAIDCSWHPTGTPGTARTPNGGPAPSTWLNPCLTLASK